MLSVVVCGDMKGNGYRALVGRKWRRLLVAIKSTLHQITGLEEDFKLI